MASRPRCETISLEFRDLQATTMSLNSTGQYALLAGRKYLGILDLNIGSGDLLVRVPYGGKYEISGTQWSSSHTHENVLAVASGQRCDIFELTDGAELKLMQKLKCHSRVITDLDWSCLSPNLLATSSFDSFVHIWDIRVPRCTGSEKPQQSLSALDGASQVRWNKWKNDTLASCDGGHIKIWDIRSPGNSPAEYIAAHSMKINGLEWMSVNTVITAAADHTVKFSRTANSNPSKSKGPCLTLNSAVWRARPTPFGRGLLTQGLPIIRRDSGILCLWDWKRFNYQSSPIFTFQANDILEFGWKTSQDSPSVTSNTLITWSRDQILRVWTLPSHIIALCGEKDSSMSTIGESDRRGSLQKNTLNGENKATDDGLLLLSDDEDDDEFGSHSTNNENNCCSNANTDHDNDNTSENDFTTTSSSSSSRFKNDHQTNGNKKSEPISYSNGSAYQLQRRKSLTSNYSNNNLTSSSSSSISKRDEVLKTEFEFLTANKPESLIIEQMEVERGLLRFSWRTDPKAGRCAVVVLVTFSHSYPATVPQFLVTSSNGSDVDNSQLQKILKQAAQQCTRKKEPCLHNCLNQFASYMNLIKPELTNDFLSFPTRGVSNVPFPRTSGGRFCSVGVLICFGRPPYLRRVKMNCNTGTPRSLSALGPFLSQLALNSDENQSSRRRSRRTEKKAGVVTIFDVGKLLPFSRELASSYHVLSSRSQCSVDRQSICLENEKKALSMNLTRVAHAWQAASIVAKYADRSYQLKKAEAENASIVASTSSLLSSSELSGDDEDVNWFHYHPLGSKLINSIIQHYGLHGDVQTAASIACVFTENPSSAISTTHNNNNNMYKGEKGITTATSTITKSPHNKKSSCLKSSSQSQAIISTSNSYATYHVSSTEPSQLQLASPMSIRNGKNVQSKPQTGGPTKKFSVPKWFAKGSSPYHNYHTVHGSDTLHGTVINPLTDSFFRQHRSNSWSDSLDDTKAIQASSMYDLQQQSNNGHGEIMSLIGDSTSSLSSHGQSTRRNSVALKRSILDPNMSRLYDSYKAQYAEILYRWGHLQQRAEVLKCLTHERYDSDFLLGQGVSFSVQCKTCHSPSSRGSYCHKCKRHSTVCSICHLPTKGLSTYCWICGHGGHVNCILGWFKKNSKCPTGCTCNCIDNITNFKAI